MGSFRFFCPTYERDIDAGFEVDEDTFRRHRLKLVSVPCPWCSRTHRFLLADGRRSVTVSRAMQSDIMAPPPEGGSADMARAGDEGRGAEG
jgi:hypothetical protein